MAVGRAYEQNLNFIERLEQFCILGILFFIPSSPAVPNILGVVLIILWLLKGQYYESWLRVRHEPIFWAMVAYLLIYPISLLWTTNLEWGLHIVSRHLIFLMFPFIFMAAKRVYLDRYITAFILGLTLTEAISYLVWFEVINIPGVSPHNPVPFYLHTEYNPVLAWGLYLVMYRLLYVQTKWWIKGMLVVFAATMTANMFITGGRGGQLTYFLVMMVLFIQFFHRKGHVGQGIMAAVVFMVGVAVTAYLSSPLFKARVDRAIHEVKHLSLQSHGSLAYRFQLYYYTIAMSFDRPLLNQFIGTGVGGLPEAYMAYVGQDRALIRLAPSTHNTADNTHTHPHNQFVYELGALGLIGVLILLSVYLAMLWYVWKFPDSPYADMRLAFVVYAFFIQMSDALLLAYPTALLFVTFSAVLFWRDKE